MRLLITGGAGFIGSNFVRYILNNYQDYKVINLDKLSYAGNRENLRDVEHNQNYQFIRGDICDEKVVDTLVRDVDIVVNFAAETHVDRSITDASEFIHTNVYGTYVLLELARKYNISKLIHISTDEVYGSRESGSFKEEDALHLVCSYFITYNLPVVITRSSNNFGPYQFPEKIIPLFITNALENKRLPLYGDGLNVRDWLYVLDSCRAIDVVFHKGKVGGIYNVAAGNEFPNLELTRLILKIMEKPQDLIEYVKDRPGHDRRYSLDWDKIRSLGWQPQYHFQQALKETIKWYQDNQEWWRKLKS